MSAYSAAVLALTPSLYWYLDGVNGATDQSGNTRNGTAGGGISIGAHAATSPGIIGESATCTDFDGVDDRVTSTYSPFTNATSRTWIGWVNRDTDTTEDIIWGSSGTGDLFEFPANPPAATARFTTFGGGQQNTDWVTWSNTTWYFYALVFNEPGDTSALYQNGALISSQSHTGTYFASDGNWLLGATGVSSAPFDGKQAHVAIFESALTGPQIASLYTAATTVSVAGGSRSLLGIGS